MMRPAYTTEPVQNANLLSILLPNHRLTAIDAPGCGSHVYQADRHHFSRKGMAKRQTFIRSAFGAEFEAEADIKSPPPTLWVQVIRFDAWHYRVPIWRGYSPLSFRPDSDLEVVAVAADCALRGGYDQACLEAWHRKRTAGA